MKPSLEMLAPFVHEETDNPFHVFVIGKSDLRINNIVLWDFDSGGIANLDLDVQLFPQGKDGSFRAEVIDQGNVLFIILNHTPAEVDKILVRFHIREITQFIEDLDRLFEFMLG